jgi:single-stranded-DNA-specific exonuclease
LWQLAGEPDRADEYLDLVALGIVADVAELTADARYLLQRGLDCLRRTQRLGLQAILASAKIDATNLSAEHIGFGLGPRLNALGRLGDANLAVELLTTNNLTRARILASQLEGLNNQRKLLMDQILIAAQEQIAKEPSLLEYNALVLHQAYWHSGVVGPVANRLAEQYQRPVVMLVGEGNVLRGSARSVAGVDITTALKLCSEFILSVGGHPGAAGLSLPAENLPVFRRALSDSVQLIRDPAAVMDGLPIDAVLPLDHVTLEFAQEIDRLAPFGEGNPAVTFAARDITIEHDRTFGRKGEHREVTVADREGHIQKLIWWRGAEIDPPDAHLDVAFRIKTSTFRGETALSIEWVDFRETEVSIAVLEDRAAAPPLQIEVIDWRTKNLAPITLQDFPAAQGVATWADGATTAPFTLTRRYDLPQADVLVIWAAPCGWRELVYAIERVKPTTIYLCAADAVADAAGDHLEPFLKRLTGLLKHDITQRGGRVNVPRLAAALNQRLITARKGVEWLEAAGQISVREWGDEHLLVELGGHTSDEADELASELKVLLAETAAWRQYYRRLKVELIADIARRAARQEDKHS